MSVLDSLTGSSAEDDYEAIESIEFSTDGELIVALRLDATEATGVELLDSDGALVQSRLLHDAQLGAVLPLRENQPVTFDLVGGGSSTFAVPRSERQRLDRPDGDPLPPGEYQVAVWEPDGPIQRKDITIPVEATLTD